MDNFARKLCHFFGVPAGARVDDDATGVKAGQELMGSLQFRGESRSVLHVESQVRTIESRHNAGRVVESKQLHDIFLDLGSCGGSQGDRERVSQSLAGLCNVQIIGPKVVTPL